MEDLQQFYEETFTGKFDPSFHQLTDEEKNVLKNTLSFAVWKMGKALQQLKTEVNKKLKKIGLKLR